MRRSKRLATFAASLNVRLAELGLSLAADKRDVYPAIPEAATIVPALFLDYTIHPLPNFILVGCPMGPTP